MTSFLQVYKSFMGPRLYRIYAHGNSPGRNYMPNILETVGDSVIKWMRFLWSASCWTSPIILTVLYRRGAFTVEGMLTAISYGTTLSCILVAAIIIRGIGRAVNPDYQRFIGTLIAAQRDLNQQTKKALEGYDSEFGPWPVYFRWDDAGSNKDKKRVDLPKASRDGDSDGIGWRLISYVSASTFGIRMVYPGKTSLINALVGQALQMGRAKLVEERKDCTRSKILTREGNEIDTMFIDRRNRVQYEGNGNTLVVCCEGNSGFYEIGSCVTPLDAGYSVLGWNHPGFAGSTGCPWPWEEQNAVDCVMQYAIHKLGFPPHDIVLYAWSIGGYTATWAAMNYPDVKSVIIDASFDDLLPLATVRMPQSFKPLVETTVKKYINLNNAEQLKRYPGPVLLIRRSRDEMITTVNPTVVESNRGNDLLLQLLQHRYPKIIDDVTLPTLRDYLSRPAEIQKALVLSSFGVDREYCESLLRSYAEEHSMSYPMHIEASNDQEKTMMALFLASVYMHDFDATHCVPLPASMFVEPWSL